MDLCSLVGVAMNKRVIAAVLSAASLALASGCRQSPEAASQRFLESGNAYAKEGKLPEAIVEYRNAAQRDPLSAEAHEKLAEALMQTGDLGDALGEFVRAADLRPNEASLQLKAGNLLLLAGRPEEARARAEKVLSANPKDVDAHILTANALAGLENLDAAVEQIEDALRVDPNRSGTYSNLGALELNRGKRDAAESAFKRAVELEPQAASAHLALGNFYWLTDRSAEAERSLNRALELEPRNPLINRALASFYLATKRAGDAEAPLKTVYEVTNAPAEAFTLAEYYVVVGRDAEAKALLQPMLDDARVSAVASARLAALEYKDGRPEEAYRRLDAVLAKDQANLQALLVKSTLLLADNRLNDAFDSAALAAERHPDSTAAMFTLGRVQAARREPEAAIAAYQEALRLNPRATEAKMALAQLHLAQGRPDASVGFAADALANEPLNANAQLLLVRGLLTSGDLDRAGQELAQLAKRFPDSPAVHTQLGMLLGRRNDVAGARGEFERALVLEPGNVEALGGLIALDLAAKNYAAARARIDKQLAAGTTPVLLGMAARTSAAANDLASAERFLRQAIELDPSYLEAYGALGQILVVEGKLPQARAEFETLVQKSPKSVGGLTMIGMLLQASGDSKGAAARFEQALRVDPDAAVAANNLAWIYAETDGNLDVALQLAKTAQRRLPDSAEVNDTLGYIYYKKDIPSLAISTLKAGVEKDPRNAIYQYHLGLAYSKAGDAVHAKDHLTKALSLKPDFDGAAEARAILQTLSKSQS